MMPNVTVEVDGNAAALRLSEMPAGISRVLIDTGNVVALALEKHIKEEELSGQELTPRTGTMRRATFHRVEVGTDNDVVVVAGGDLTKAPYYREQDQGGALKAKKSQFLAVPIGAALTGKGNQRFTARELIANPSAFGYVGTFMHNQVIFGKRANGKAVPLFALKSQVTLKQVGFLAHTLNEKRDWVQDTYEKAIGDSLK